LKDYVVLRVKKAVVRTKKVATKAIPITDKKKDGGVSNQLVSLSIAFFSSALIDRRPL